MFQEQQKWLRMVGCHFYCFIVWQDSWRVTRNERREIQNTEGPLAWVVILSRHMGDAEPEPQEQTGLPPSCFPVLHWLNFKRNKWFILVWCLNFVCSFKENSVPGCFALRYSPLRDYSFILAVYWKHLGLTSEDEYETRDQYVSMHLPVFTSRSVTKLRR